MMREIFQHIDDIEIPIIEITQGWAAESIKTRAEADDAFSYLMSAVAQIEYALDMELSKPKSSWDLQWLARAKCALKYKKAALQIVAHKRAYISEAEKRKLQETRDRTLLEYIRAVVPDRQFLEWVCASGVGVAPRAEADEVEEEAA